MQILHYLCTSFIGTDVLYDTRRKQQKNNNNETNKIQYNTRPNHKQQTHSQYNNKDNIKNFNNDNDNNNYINNNIIMLTMFYLNIHTVYQAITKKKKLVAPDSIFVRNR